MTPAYPRTGIFCLFVSDACARTGWVMVLLAAFLFTGGGAAASIGRSSPDPSPLIPPAVAELPESESSAAPSVSAAPTGPMTGSAVEVEPLGTPLALFEEEEHAEHGKEGAIPEIPNAIHLLYELFEEKHIHSGASEAERSKTSRLLKMLHKGPLKEPLPIIGTLQWENHVFAGIGALILIGFFALGVRKMSLRSPSRWQVFVEMLVEGFDRFVRGILGEKQGRRFAPYIATLFLFILINNLMVLVPFFKAATSSLVLTGSLALLTFLIVQATALVELGPLGYLYHLCGSPRSVIEWCLAPLFLVLHIIGELARPVSLALRLFGNVLGEDILLGAFVLMGVGLASVFGVYPPAPGIPLHFPFLFLVMLTSTIQALVFSLLTTIYILLVLPHGHEEHGEEAEGASQEAPGAGTAAEAVAAKQAA